MLSSNPTRWNNNRFERLKRTIFELLSKICPTCSEKVKSEKPGLCSMNSLVYNKNKLSAEKPNVEKPTGTKPNVEKPTGRKPTVEKTARLKSDLFEGKSLI
jgi:hypothetical protein